MSKRAKERRRTVADLPLADRDDSGELCVDYEPPVVTLVGNLNDLLASVCAPHDEDV